MDTKIVMYAKKYKEDKVSFPDDFSGFMGNLFYTPITTLRAGAGF